MTQEQIKAIAERYRSGPHQPLHPSYRVFVQETLDQFRDLLAVGYRFVRSESEPYATSRGMFEDMEKQRLLVYTGGQSFVEGHPLATRYRTWNQTKWGLQSINEVFRAVHDINGHGPTLAPFETFEGEMEATRNHTRMYSQDAWPALYGETVGQLCHYHAGLGYVKAQRAVVLSQGDIELCSTL